MMKTEAVKRFVRSKPCWTILLFLAFLSVAVLLVAVESSPFYPFNSWNDPNCFFSVARAMLDGKVLYRDIYEQKGPYLYFFHAICALISSRSFIGVFLMELVLCFLLLFFVYRILRLYGIEDFKRVALICSLIALTVYFSFAGFKGDSAEEICNPFLLSVVYLSLKRIKTDGKFKIGDYLYIGAAAGFVFWMKFTLTAFFIGWFVFFLCHTVKTKQFSQIGVAIGFIAAGVLIATLPCFLYFAVNGAIGDWLHVYLYDNLFLYQKKENIFVRVGTVLGNILETFGKNIHYNLFVVFGIVHFAGKKSGKSASERMFLLLVPALMTVLLFIGGRGYRYYGLPISIFTVFGYIAAAERGFTLEKRWRKIALSALTVALCTFFLFINGHTDYIFRKKEDTVPYKFAKIMEKREDAKLLNYGFLDSGFYFAAGQAPAFKYFCTLNIPLPEMYEEMERYLDEGEPDFVVVQLTDDCGEELERANYREIARETRRSLRNNFLYILYEKI